MLVATIYVLVTSLAYHHDKIDVLLQHPELKHIGDPIKRAERTHIFERRNTAMDFLNKYSNVISMIATPLTCFVFWLFYARGRYRYSEHLVAGMYMNGFTNLIYAFVFIPLGLLINLHKADKSSRLLLMIYLLFQVIYYAVFYFNFMNRRTVAAACKAFIAGFAAIAFWFFLSGFLVGWYIRFGI